MLSDAETQFAEHARIEHWLIRAHSPQAKGRVERSFGTAQDRWVKELRLADARTAEQANLVLGPLAAGHNKRFAKQAKDSAPTRISELGRSFDLAAILSLQEERVVANDYTIRFQNRFLPAAQADFIQANAAAGWSSRDASGMAACDPLQGHYLKYQKVTRSTVGGSAPNPGV